ncbi:MAG TPA: hypothetical protein VLF66_12560, partial [Thermoanaerobaculia bacterium]|nr:hypothetical protein [Thermoanaerobaculia bacterium]
RVRLAGFTGPGVAAGEAPVWEALLSPEAEGAAAGPTGPLGPAAPVELLFRPESLRLVPRGEAVTGALPGRVAVRRYGGPLTYYRVVLDPGAEAEESPREVEVLGPAGAAADGDAVLVAPRADGPPPRAFPRPEEPERVPDEAPGEAP